MAQQISVTVSSSNGDLILPLAVDPNQTVSHLKQLVEVSSGILFAQQRLSFEGRELSNNQQTLTQVGIKNFDLVIVDQIGQQTQQSGHQQQQQQQPTVNWTPQQVQQYYRNNPSELQQLLHADPTLAEAVLSDDLTLLTSILQQRAQVIREREMKRIMEINAIEADPFNLDYQKKIEQEITQANIDENMEAAIEHNPEAFGRVVMLYIDVEVNGHALKAFVDSGAQTTIMSVQCAQRCGIMRLVDRRWAGVARGVGTAEIVGRVHVAPIKIGKTYFSSSFTVLANNSGTELLLGLDMLKKHQCSIDLRDNVLRIGEEKAPFLSENAIPLHARFDVSEEEMKDANNRNQSSSTSTSTSSTSSSSGNLSQELQRQLEQQMNDQNIRRGSPPVPRANPPSTGGPVSTGGQFNPPQQQQQPQQRPPQQHNVPQQQQVGGGPPESSIATLTGLGFGRQESIQALSMCGGNVDAAASYLFSRSGGFNF